MSRPLPAKLLDLHRLRRPAVGCGLAAGVNRHFQVMPVQLALDQQNFFGRQANEAGFLVEFLSQLDAFGPA